MSIFRVLAASLLGGWMFASRAWSVGSVPSRRLTDEEIPNGL